MRQDTTALDREIERKARLSYYGPLIWAGVGIATFALFFRGYDALITRADDREWGNAPLQQSEATCVRSQSLNSRTMSGWANTFRIGEKELASRDRDSCIVGQRYQLTYQIGRTGLLKVETGRLL